MPLPSKERRPNAALRQARLRLNLSQGDLAKALREAGWTSCDSRTLQRYENGTTVNPQYLARRALTAVFKMPLYELGFPQHEHEDEDDVDRRQLLTATAAELINEVGGKPASHTRSRPAAPDHHESQAAPVTVRPGLQTDDQMDRRGLLQALAVLGVTASPAIDALRHIQGSVDDVLGRDDGLHLDEWEEIVAEYGYSYISHPPHLLLPAVAADLVTVRTIMSRNEKSALSYRGWCRVTSGLAMVLAKTLANLHQSREARTWWTTSRHAADVSGDQDLALWVTAERLVHGLYERRPTQVLLRQADAASQSASDVPGRGLAQIRTARAQLLALDGRRAEAIEELARSRHVFEGLPSTVTGNMSSMAGWGEDRLRYTEAWVFAHLGDRAQLDDAVARTLEALSPAQQRTRTQIKLLQSFGHIRAGDTVEGVRHASATYEAHSVEQRTSMVNSLAELVLEAVPAPRRQDPAVRGYQELLATGTQRKMIR